MKDLNNISDWLAHCKKEKPIIPDNPKISLVDFPIQKRAMKLTDRNLLLNLFGNDK